MPEISTKFIQLLHLIYDAKVRFVVIGGVALNLHGADNVTFDMDISFARDAANTNALAGTLKSQNARYRGFPPDLPCIIDSHTLRNSTNLTLETTLCDFDLLAQPEGIDDFEGLWNRAVTMDVDGMPLRVASLDDLLSMKRAANRPKDATHHDDSSLAASPARVRRINELSIY